MNSYWNISTFPSGKELFLTSLLCENCKVHFKLLFAMHSLTGKKLKRTVCDKVQDAWVCVVSISTRIFHLLLIVHLIIFAAIAHVITIEIIASIIVFMIWFYLIFVNIRVYFILSISIQTVALQYTAHWTLKGQLVTCAIYLFFLVREVCTWSCINVYCSIIGFSIRATHTMSSLQPPIFIKKVEFNTKFNFTKPNADRYSEIPSLWPMQHNVI